MDLVGGFAAFVAAGEKVLLKPNLLVGSAPERAVTTHPEVLRAVALGCLEAGAEVWVGDSPGFGSPTKVAQQCGILDVCRELGIEFKPLDEGAPTSFPEGKVAKSFLLGAPVLAADKVISLAKLKTHGLTYYTGAVKNLYGTIAGIEKARLHLTYPSGIELGRMLYDLYRFLRPPLSLVDGVVAMEGSGPRTGDPRQVGLILAGDDAVAVDTVAAHLIGLPDGGVPYLGAAVEDGLAAADIGRITLSGVPLAEARVPGYRLPATSRASRLPVWTQELGRRLLTARPVIIPDLCVACGICKTSCPAGAVEIGNGRAIIDDGPCIRCYCCQEMCPEGAVELRRTLLSRLTPWR